MYTTTNEHYTQISKPNGVTAVFLFIANILVVCVYFNKLTIGIPQYLASHHYTADKVLQFDPSINAKHSLDVKYIHIFIVASFKIYS